MAQIDTTLARAPALAGLIRSARRFFAWWGGELATFVPEKLRSWWHGADRIVAISMTGELVEFARIVHNRRQVIATADIGRARRSPATLRETLQRAAGGGHRLVLCLPADRVLARRITLPLAVAENLRQTLAFELDRYTPFKPDQAYFAHRVVERDGQRNSLLVELAAVSRPTVDEAMAAMANLGLRPDGTTLADDLVRHGGAFLNFTPDRAAQPRQASAQTMWRAFFAVVAVMLLAAVLIIPLWQKREAAIALLAPLGEARSAAQETDRLRDQLNKLVAAHNFVPDRKWAAPSPVMVLDELTRRLPDDTFVLQLDYDGKTVQVMGETSTSSTLVDTMEASPLFKDVGFKAQLTKIQGTNADRFHLGATLENPERPRKPPEAAPAGTAAGAAALPANAGDGKP